MQRKLQRKSSGRLAVRTAWVILILTVLASPFWVPGSKAAAATRTVTADKSLRAWAGHQWLFGADYRDLWSTPIEVDVLDLSQEAGRLTPSFRVGGAQTYGLAFQGTDGKSYTFRSLVKDNRQNLHEDMRDYVVGDIFQDQLAANHPGAALIVPPLAEAAGVLHNTPRLVILPDDPALGEFRELFAGRLGTFLEFPTPASDTYAGFNEATDILDTKSFLSKWLASREVRLDGRALVRARLLDFLIGDWDRHANNWRWAQLPGQTAWQPIPEDRDQAFADFQGALLTLARPFQPKFFRFKENYPTRTGLILQGWQVLRWFLAELDYAAWIEIATDMRNRVTDAVIDEAVRRMPAPYYELSGDRLARLLKTRRDQLPDIADRIYRFMIAEVDVQATDQSDRIELRDAGEGWVEVSVALKSGGAPYFQRKLSPRETTSLRLYLRSGQNTVVCQGPVGRKIKIDVIGRRDQDVLEGCEAAKLRFTETEEVERRKLPARIKPNPILRLTLPTENVPPESERPRDWRWRMVPIYTVSVGSSHGLLLGGGITYDRYAFGKTPFAQRHSVRGAYSFGLSTFELAYEGAYQHWNPRLQSSLAASISGLEQAEFFGFGNDTSDDDGGNDDLFETDQLRYTVAPGLRYALTSKIDFFGEARVLYASTDDDDDSLLNQTQVYGVGDFGWLSAVGGVDFDTRDRSVLYSPGVHIRLQGSVSPEVWDVESTFGAFEGEAAGYLGLGSRLLLALRIGGKNVFGTFPYQEAAYIGGRTTVRGYDTNRFAGDASIFANGELRFTLGKASAWMLRAEYGLFVFGDVGRVFSDADTSDDWHPSGGGGISAATLDRTLLWSLTVARGEEQTTFFFQADFTF
ncbi:MAG: BamA/TamA family outer membrane protein [Candidatus Tectomicrobia bacterium]|nr:BamA/TamA family outer membrane protein [Candidatus Tectomicrobia bacterium]